MQYCTACQKAPAKIVIMDLTDGNLVGQQHLCESCATVMGVVAPKEIKASPELLEDILGGLADPSPAASPRSRELACPGCGMTIADFKVKGRLGCARCYETFRGDLVPLLDRVHEAASHCGRMPVRTNWKAEPIVVKILAELRARLEDAVRGERYEEAAQLRDALRQAEEGGSKGKG